MWTLAFTALLVLPAIELPRFIGHSLSHSATSFATGRICGKSSCDVVYTTILLFFTIATASVVSATCPSGLATLIVRVSEVHGSHALSLSHAVRKQHSGFFVRGIHI